MSETHEQLIVINAPHFYCGVILQAAHVTRPAPIVKYMLSWPRDRVLLYCKSKKWQTLEVPACPTAS